MLNMIRFIYSYPVEIGIDIFLYTVSITTLIAFMTVSSQTLKAARSNPVNALKYEWLSSTWASPQMATQWSARLNRKEGLPPAYSSKKN